MPTLPLTIPGFSFSNGAEALRVELVDFLNSDRDIFPILRIFDFIDLVASNASLKQKFIDRGEFSKLGNGKFQNRARHTFSEQVSQVGPNVENFRLFVPRDLDVLIEAKEQGDIVTIEVPEASVLLIFDKNPAPGFRRSFFLKRIEGRAEKWVYTMIGENDPSQSVVLTVDMTIAPNVRFAPESDFQLIPGKPFVVKSLSGEKAAKSDSPCNICEAREGDRRDEGRKCPSPETVLEVELLCIVVGNNGDNRSSLSDKFQDDLIRARDFFGTRTDIHLIDRGTIRYIDDASSTIVHETNSGGRSRALKKLLDRYFPDDVSENTIVCFYITELVGITAGTATTGAVTDPWLIVEEDANDVTFVHEVGHVLGLHHSPDSTNFMHSSAVQFGIYPEQIRKMRCSPVLREQ